MRQIANSFSSFLETKKKKSLEEERDALLDYLSELEKLEAKLWGVTITKIKDDEEHIIEDINHLIYRYSHTSKNSIKNVLKSKSVHEFLQDLETLKYDFNLLKKSIKEKNKLKNYLTIYTVKMIDSSNYIKMKNVFLLEKQLHEVIDWQEKNLNELFSNFSKFRITTNKIKEEGFLEILKELRSILGGHLDHHELWEEEREGYSNISNILHSLKKSIRNSLE